MKSILFLTLKVFSATGGIEKVCRLAGKVYYENVTRLHKRLNIFSMHDRQQDAFDNLYFPTEIFTGFNANKINFVWQAVKEGCNSNLVIISHINLLLVGWLIKKISPHTKIVLIAHGIEIWQPLPGYKKKMLNCCDEIDAVSQFTASKIIDIQNIPAAKVKVLNNCLDPFLPLPKNVALKEELLKSYGFQAGDIILFTLTRLASTERYKGYDKVLEALKEINRPDVKYLVAGSYDKAEKKFLEEKIHALNLSRQVVMAGFVPDEDLAAHFMMADMYVMPSSKEGFGIVFIEAMYYGLPVIAGNADGSVDALLNGELGLLVNPQNTSEIKTAIEKILAEPSTYIPDQKMLLEHFSYESYKERVNEMLLRM